VIDLVSVLQKSLEQSGAKEKSKGKSRTKKAHPTRKAA
jgi:non-homologous end joining protein Ku